MDELFASILTAVPLDDAVSGRRFLSLLADSGLSPDLFGNWEPLRSPFDPGHPETALEAWRDPFLWKRTSEPSASGGVWITHGVSQARQHSAVNIRMAHTEAWPHLVEFVRSASMALSADFAFIEPLSGRGVERGRRNGTVHALNKKGTRWSLSVTTQDLKRCLPGAYWAMTLGGPYVGLFGLDRLLTAPTHLAEALNPQMVYLQLSEKASDVITDADMLDNVRERVMAHLGVEAFFPNERNVYEVPTFSFDERRTLS